MYFQTVLTLCALFGPPKDQDLWWGMQLAGQPVGYYHEAVHVLSDGHIVTKAEMKMILNRLGHKIEFDSTSETEETADGDFCSVHSTTRTSDQVLKLQAERKEATLEIVTETGGKSYTQRLPISRNLSGPFGFSRNAFASLQKPGDQVVGTIFVPELGKITTEKRTVVGAEQRSGKPVRKIEDEIEGVPGKQTLLVEEDGAIVERRQPFPFGDLNLATTDRLTALAMTAGGTLPDELYDRTLVRSNVRLPDPRSLDRIKLRLTHHRPELGWPDLGGDNQEVLKSTVNERVIEVRRVELPGAVAVARSAADEAEYRGANALIQSDDPGVVRLAHSLTGGHSAYPTVRALQDWVATHMKFDLGIALAPASEVVKNRRGTCAAYSILLCALERAAGIPARVAWGYVFEEGIWGGHAWTEIRMGDRWIPLDSAMYSPGPADAARFQFAVSSLQNGPSNLTGAGLQLYGNIEVQVLEYTVHGRTVQVPADAVSYRITGDTYTNPWLQTILRKPQGWRFSDLKDVFPDPTLVALEGKNGGSVKLQTESLRGDKTEIAQLFTNAGLHQSSHAVRCGGHAGYRVDTPTKAMIVVPTGGAVWILVSQGKDAVRSLDKVASTWSLQ